MNVIRLPRHSIEVPQPTRPLDDLVRENEGADFRDDEYDARLFRPHVTVGLVLAVIAFSAALVWIAVRGGA